MNERISLQDLIDLLAKKQDITKKDAEAFLRELIAVITENIEAGESVKIKDFGTFKLVKVSPRKSVDVNTGQAIEIAAHYKLSFVPDKSLKEAINRPFAHFESVVLEEGVNFDNIESETLAEVDENEEDATVDEDDTMSNIAEPQANEVAELSKVAEAVLEAKESISDITSSEPEIVKQEVTEAVVEEALTEAVVAEVIAEKQEEETKLKIESSEVIEAIAESENAATKQNATSEAGEESISESESKEEELEEEAAKEELLELLTEDPLGEEVDEDIETIDENTRKKGLKKKYIRLTFLVVLLIAGFVFAGLYFEKMAVYLTEGFNEKNNKVALSDEPVAIADSLTAPIDSLAQKKDSTHLADQPKEAISEPVKPAEEKPLGSETISSGHTLRNISLKYYGNKSFWVYIYEENRDKIKNANNVPLGTVLVIPAPSKYGIDAKDKESVRKARKIEEELFKQMELN